MRQFDQWIGGGHWLRGPRESTHAERGGRDGGQEKAPLHQVGQWIGCGRRFWHPRCALLAERGGREGPRERRRPRRHGLGCLAVLPS